MNENEWDVLLSAISAGRVIPVIGNQLIRESSATAPLILHVAESLAENLGLEIDSGQPLTLNDVVTRLLAGDKRVPLKKIYDHIHQLVGKTRLQPPEHLRLLAKISHFNLFLTTTFDPTFERTLNDVRFGGVERTQVCPFSIKGWQDIPDWKKDTGTCLTYLLGRSGTTPRSFVIWDADAIDSVLHFHDLVKDGKSLPHLQAALRECDLLFLGVNLTDWLARFFLRIARQDSPASDPDYCEYLAERSQDLTESFVAYCRSARKGTRIVNCDPVAFVEELSRRWEDKFVEVGTRGDPKKVPFIWPSTSMPRDAVFISYAHEDVIAAKTLTDGLRAGGCDVWLDRERLEAGDNWENKLEVQVKKHCSVFISLISKQTEESAGYCHRERKWAADRDPDFGKEGNFYIPVTIDATPKSELTKENLPTRPINVCSLLCGVPTPEFVGRILALQNANRRGEKV